MKKAMIAMVLASLIGGPSAALAAAGSATGVRVAKMTIVRTYGNFVFIHLSEAPATRSSCATNSYWHFTLALDDAAGKNMYAQLLAAFASGSLVDISGTDACSEFGAIESVGGLGLSDGS